MFPGDSSNLFFIFAYFNLLIPLSLALLIPFILKVFIIIDYTPPTFITEH